MAITIKKYCSVCGCEIHGEDEIYQTCTEGVVRVSRVHYCHIHSKESSTSLPVESSKKPE